MDFFVGTGRNYSCRRMSSSPEDSSVCSSLSPSSLYRLPSPPHPPSLGAPIHSSPETNYDHNEENHHRVKICLKKPKEIEKNVLITPKPLPIIPIIDPYEADARRTSNNLLRRQKEKQQTVLTSERTKEMEELEKEREAERQREEEERKQLDEETTEKIEQLKKEAEEKEKLESAWAEYHAAQWRGQMEEQWQMQSQDPGYGNGYEEWCHYAHWCHYRATMDMMQSGYWNPDMEEVPVPPTVTGHEMVRGPFFEDSEPGPSTSAIQKPSEPVDIQRFDSMTIGRSLESPLSAPSPPLIHSPPEMETVCVSNDRLSSGCSLAVEQSANGPEHIEEKEGENLEETVAELVNSIPQPVMSTQTLQEYYSHFDESCDDILVIDDTEEGGNEDMVDEIPLPPEELNESDELVDEWIESDDSERDERVRIEERERAKKEEERRYFFRGEWFDDDIPLQMRYHLTLHKWVFWVYQPARGVKKPKGYDWKRGRRLYRFAKIRIWKDPKRRAKYEALVTRRKVY